MSASVQKEFTGNARRAQLTGAITDSAVSFVVDDATGFPTGASHPFVVVIGRGTATEEKLLCASRSSTSFTVTTRGYDSTTAAAHSATESVEHEADALFLTDLSIHVYDTTADDHTQYILKAGTRGFDGVTAIAAAPSASAVGDTVSAGTATTLARSDHRHAREAFATPAVVLGTAAAAGSATTHIRSDSTIVAFDATVPVTQAAGDSAATGSAAVAARRDHKHGMPAAISTGSNLLAGDVTITNTNTFYTGPTVSLAAGTWLVVGTVTVAGAGVFTAKLWDGTTVSSSASIDGGESASMSAIVTPGTTTSYKISVACTDNSGPSTIKAATPSNGAGNNASHIFGIKIA